MDLAARLRSQLLSQNLPCPSASFLASLTSTRSPPPPLPSLVATAKSRLLACDLTTSDLLDPSHLPCLPAEALDAARTPEVVLRQDTCVQVLDVENLSSSRWQQIEELEAVERGAMTRGRHVVRVTGDADADADADASPSAAPGRNATHRLVLQDRCGTRVYAVELSRMQDLGLHATPIGCKLVLRAGAVVARGSVLLTPETCIVLGGKIDAWHEEWLRGRMTRLKEAVGIGAAHAASR